MFPILNQDAFRTLTKINDWTLRHRPMCQFVDAEIRETLVEGHGQGRCFLLVKKNQIGVECFVFDITSCHTIRALVELAGNFFELKEENYISKPEDKEAFSAVDLSCSTLQNRDNSL